MALQFFNSYTRTLEEFIPLKDKTVSFYACGPTVYNYAHIGNLRAYVFEDVLRRTLEYLGYSVEHVMNITDVGHLTDDGDEGEDKMVKRSRESGRSVWDIAQFYTDAFFQDTDRLNIRRPSVACAATEHVDDMIALIRRLEEKGFTYTAGGNVYFDTSKFTDYGRMALLDRQEQQAGARVDVDENKRHPRDFVLWFTQSKYENHIMLWDSPWGRGYPGWHIECSAMSMKYLGEQFDIHCGGIDHIPVHHTNEIAQSEAATGKQWVRYWLHNEFLLMDSGKMSKSKGGFLTLQSLIDEGYDPLDYRYFLLGAHYRTQLRFSFDNLKSARSARISLVERIRELLGSGAAAGDVSALSERGMAYREAFRSDLEADLNTPRALATVWTLMKDKELAGEEALTLLYDFDQVLGLRLCEVKAPGEYVLSAEEKSLLEERNTARKEKNFARADEIRDYFSSKGLVLKDTSEGTVVKPAEV
ncbi:cysteine--tRNA ligase [Marispirochaeta aestuarii]|uniref:Cysteine--tRNA ligase n=1 Tax=Marispirochaeta aestuarii TaxID=1963862 RepID=A0A1Y1RVU8_9SPIO|nr:cysteine--tRNA ligase [Marispirochaeta aestuarii]ORC32813.1 cysteine--tRNA ligase [Marispirochaeta aestuarii]